MLRDQGAVAEIARAAHGIAVRPAGLAQHMANELALIAHNQRRHASGDGAALMTVLVGEDHRRAD